MEGDAADKTKSQGEVVMDYPQTTGLPFPSANGSLCASAMRLDVPRRPPAAELPGAMIQAQMVRTTKATGVIAYVVGPSTTTPATLMAKKWYEFRVGSLGGTDFGGPDMVKNVTGLGAYPPHDAPRRPAKPGRAAWSYLDHYARPFTARQLAVAAHPSSRRPSATVR